MKPLSNGPISTRMATPWRGGTPNQNHEAQHSFVKYDPTEGIAEEFGDCVNTIQRVRRGGRMTTKCLNFNVILGNGYCMACWDEQVDRQGNNRRERMKGASNKDSKYLPIDISSTGK